MAFRFALAAVLKYRESLEQRAYLALERVQQDIVQTEQHMLACEERYSAARMRRNSDLGRGITSVHLQAEYEEELALKQEMDRLRMQLQQLHAKRQECLKAYEAARRNREVLDDLRVQQFEAYRREQAKREQKTLDDVFLSRRKRGQ